jgi:hypothetical protein
MDASAAKPNSSRKTGLSSADFAELIDHRIKPYWCKVIVESMVVPSAKATVGVSRSGRLFSTLASLELMR